MEKINIEIGTVIQTGGCAGKISKIEGEKVTVTGVYTYPPDDENDNRELFSEHWSIVYNKSDLEGIPIWFTRKDGVIIWDAIKIPYREGY